MPNSTSPITGTTMTFRKTMTVAEQALFTGISGNLAPLCVDASAARRAGFDNALCFELALASLATTALNRVAGADWRIGAITLDFKAAVPVGSTLEASVTVADVASNAIRCDVRCEMQGRGTVIAGSATLVPVAA